MELPFIFGISPHILFRFNFGAKKRLAPRLWHSQNSVGKQFLNTILGEP